MKNRTLKIVSMIKIDGAWRQQDDLTKEELREALERKLDVAMKNIGFERITAA